MGTIYSRTHYQQNKQVYKDRATKFKAELKNWFLEYKKTFKCEICETDKYWRLTFHHLDPSQKDGGVAEMVNNHKSRELIMKEIGKCQVLCQNCHQDVHHEMKWRSLV